MDFDDRIRAAGREIPSGSGSRGDGFNVLFRRDVQNAPANV
jgi:hypothetical protein